MKNNIKKLIILLLGFSILISGLMIFLKILKPSFFQNIFPGFSYILKDSHIIKNYKEYINTEEIRKKIYSTYREGFENKNSKEYLYVETGLLINQGVHPDVIKLHDNKSNDKYYMAFTPYPFGRDKYENPHFVTSSDGKVFKSPLGIQTPLVSTPEDNDNGGHFSDTDMIYENGKFSMYFVYNKKNVFGKTKFYSINSNDGIKWSEPKVVYETREGYSPTIVKEDSKYKMWYFEGEGNLVVSESSDPYKWSGYKKCNINMGKWLPWHIDIQKNSEGYEGLVCARNVELNTRALFYVNSKDGINFSSSEKPILFPKECSWDSKEIYRSSFIKENGKYRVWYSARGNYYRWNIGYTEYTESEIKNLNMK